MVLQHRRISLSCIALQEALMMANKASSLRVSHNRATSIRRNEKLGFTWLAHKDNLMSSN